MKSRLAEEARSQLAEDLRRLNAPQRLQAFLMHCQLITRLQRAGAVARRPSSGIESVDAH